MKSQEIFRVEGLPIFQNKVFHDREAAIACPRGDMVLVQDLGSGLIFNASFDAGLLKYDKDYQNEQACSAVFQRHLEAVETIIRKYFQDKKIIEVGCGKGFFLEHLQRSGFEITGIDPAYEGDNPKVVKACFEAGLGLSADGIVLRHVLEHVPDPLAFLRVVAQANGGSGQIYIEVPCLDWISIHRAWFDIFYEHVNYFRLSDLTKMFSTIHACGHLFGGQYVFVVADLASLQQPVLDQDAPFALPADFLTKLDGLASVISGKRNVVWGGASKGVIFSLYMQHAGINIDFLIDINPAKQDKYIAGTGCRIHAPEVGLRMLEPGDNIIVMNSNYYPEIVARSHNRYNYLQVDEHEL